jgi:hypothetical protein
MRNNNCELRRVKCRRNLLICNFLGSLDEIYNLDFRNEVLYLGPCSSDILHDIYWYLVACYQLSAVNLSLITLQSKAVPWLGPRRPGFDPGSVHVGFVVDKVTLGQVFPEYFGFLLSISFNRCSFTRRNEKSLIIFITGLHNTP